MKNEVSPSKAYEVRAKDYGIEFVVGWTHTPDGEPLVSLVNKHPVWTDPVVIERSSGKKVEPVSVPLSIYTIGHSNHSMAKLVDLLKRNRVEVVVDVRSSPYSRFAKHFGKESLQTALREEGFKYLYLGKELGGKPQDRAFHDEDGNVLYEKIAETQAFKDGIERLIRGIKIFNVAILCAEEDPAKCHRSLLVGKVLMSLGVTLRNIRGNGELEIQVQEKVPVQLVMDAFRPKKTLDTI